MATKRTEARKQLERVLAQYRKGLITEKEKCDAIYTILYGVLYD